VAVVFITDPTFNPSLSVVIASADTGRTAKAEPAASAVTTNSLRVRVSPNRRLRGLSYLALLLSQSAQHPSPVASLPRYWRFAIPHAACGIFFLFCRIFEKGWCPAANANESRPAETGNPGAAPLGCARNGEPVKRGAEWILLRNSTSLTLARMLSRGHSLTYQTDV
jgi:hypothetical protein